MAELLPLPISPRDFLLKIVDPALGILPAKMRSDLARIMLCAIALQESRLAHRWQVIDLKRPEVKGPARGLLQFERGTRASRGGVWGVYLHEESRDHLEDLCRARDCDFHPDAIYAQIERDDILAAGVARLLLWTDPKALPPEGATEEAWELYLRTWRPGAAQRQYQTLRDKWSGNYKQALEASKS